MPLTRGHLFITQEMALFPTFVAHVKEVKFYDLWRSSACRGKHEVLRRNPNNLYDANCVDVLLLRGRLFVGYVEAPVAARLSPLMRDAHVEVVG